MPGAKHATGQYEKSVAIIFTNSAKQRSKINPEIIDPQEQNLAYQSETDGNMGIISKPSIPCLLVSVSVSIEAFFESRYQSRYRSRGLCIFCKLWVEFLLILINSYCKVSVSASVPGHFPGISNSIGLD